MRISVITVVLNPEDDFCLTAESIIGQDYDDIEWVVIDGQSWGSGAEFIARYRDDMDVFVSQPDEGVYSAMNTAWQMATGDFIVFMNAGDIFYRNDTLTDVARHLDPACDIVYGDHDFVKGGVHHFRKSAAADAIFDLLKIGDVEDQWHSRLPCHQATFYRRAIFETEIFSLRYRICADHEFFLRMCHQGRPMAYMDLTVCRYYGGGYSSKFQNRCSNEWAEIYSSYSDQPDKVFSKFAGDVASRGIAIRPKLIMTGGFYGFEGPYPNVDLPRLTWIDASGITLISVVNQENVQITLSGRARFAQSLQVHKNDEVVLVITLHAGNFSIDQPLPGGIALGDVVKCKGANATALGTNDVRVSSWMFFAADLHTPAFSDKAQDVTPDRLPIIVTAPDTGQMVPETAASAAPPAPQIRYTSHYEIERNPDCACLESGFAPWSENREFVWLAADEGRIAPTLSGSVTLETLILDAGFFPTPDFQPARLSVRINGVDIPDITISDWQRTTYQIPLGGQRVSRCTITLIPSRGHAETVDGRMLSLQLFGFGFVWAKATPDAEIIGAARRQVVPKPVEA